MKNTQDRNDKMFDIILEEAFEKYASDVVEEGAEYKLTDEEVVEMESKRQEIYNNIMKSVNKKSKKSFPVKRIVVLAAVFAVILSMLFAIPSVGALKILLYQTITDVKGTILNINSEKVMEESYNVISNFENKSEIIIPGWLPPDMELIKTNDIEERLLLNYNSEKVWISFKTENLTYNTDSKIETKNNQYVVDECYVMGMECSIVEIISENNTKVYIASFCSNKTYYSITTNGSRIMLETVLKNLKYFEE